MECFTKEFIIIELQGYLPNDIYALLDSSNVYRNAYKKIRLLRYWNFNEKYSIEFCNNMNKFSYAIENSQKQLSIKIRNMLKVKEGNICNIGKVHSLDLSGCYGVNSRTVGILGNLHTLNLSHCNNVTDKGLKYLGKVHTLNLNGCKQVTDKGVRYLSKVNTLDLTNCNNITDEGIKHLNSIKCLTLSCRRLSAIPIEFLSSCRSLCVVDSKIEDASNLKNLESLCFIDLSVVPKSIQELKAKNLFINVICTGISNEEILELANRDVLNYKLDLSCCKNILNSSLEYFSNLHTLNLRNCCKISDEGIKYLGSCQELNLFGCYDITDNGLKYLSKVKIIILDPYFTKNITDNCLIGLGNVFVEGKIKNPIQSWSPYKREGGEIYW